MLIVKTNKQLPRLVSIPGNVDKKKFRELQKGKEIDLPEGTASSLIAMGFAVEVASKKKTIKKEAE